MLGLGYAYCRPIRGVFWAYPGPSLPYLGPIVGLFWAYPNPILGLSWVSLNLFEPVLGPF